MEVSSHIHQPLKGATLGGTPGGPRGCFTGATWGCCGGALEGPPGMLNKRGELFYALPY